jgi:hypothetical protein
MEHKIWFDETTGQVLRDFRAQPLDTNLANNVGDIVRKHLVCRLQPTDFNDACAYLREENGVEFVGFLIPTNVPLDEKTGLPAPCANCPAITQAAKDELVSSLAF